MTGLDLAVFVAVLALRLIVPLGILRYPLPAIGAALIIDAVDQTIFQILTDIDLEAFNYQGYDKALDVFYLTIAYLSTFRNWMSGTAIAVAAALWYYRLVGVTLFELTEWRPLLLLFPNTFEYFFIFIAIVALQWDPRRLSDRQIVSAAAAIWVFIKLPQEYWIHIAQLDTTDVIKRNLFGVDPSEPWGAAAANRPVVLMAVLGVVVGAIWTANRVWQGLPSPDHRLTFDADQMPRPAPIDPHAPRPWHQGLVEKTALLALVSTIFANAVGETRATAAEVTVAVVMVVAANAILTQFVRRLDVGSSSTPRAFITTAAVNTVVLIVFRVVGPLDDRKFTATAFFLFLLSLIITLFDRYRRPGQAHIGPTSHSVVTGGVGA